jgi:hypothetical protein
MEIKQIVDNCGVERIDISNYLDISRQQLNNWIKGKAGENHGKILSAIKTILDQRTDSINQTMEGLGMQVAGNISGSNQITINKGNEVLIEVVRRFEVVIQEKVAMILERDKTIVGLQKELEACIKKKGHIP